MPWFKIDDGFHCHPKVLAAGTAAVGLYVRCGSWSAQQMSNGIVPKRVAKMYGTARMIRALIDAGLWHEKGHGCTFCPQLDANSYAIHEFLAYNLSRNQVLSERANKAERQKRWREGQRKNQQVNDSVVSEASDDVDGRVDASTDGATQASRDASKDAAPTRPDPTTSSNEEVGERPRSTPDLPEPVRADVEKVCRALVDAIVANGSKRPTITKSWRTSARLLIDKDGRSVEQILTAIDWCQNNEFWKANVLSMPKLRDKYDQLRLAAQREQRAALAPTGTHGYQSFRNPENHDVYDEDL